MFILSLLRTEWYTAQEIVKREKLHKNVFAASHCRLELHNHLGSTVHYKYMHTKIHNFSIPSIQNKVSTQLENYIHNIQE